MERLSGQDATFLYNETPTEHMHTLKVAVFDPAPGGTPPFELLREEVGRRLARFAAFRRRLARVPGDLHHPVWVEGGEPDLDYHVRRARIPAPGTSQEMDRVVGRLAGWPLDRAHPLWQLWLLEGRADGRVAVMVKLHHSVADGVAVNALLGSLMSTDPESSLAELPPEAPVAAEQPGPARLLADAARDLVADTVTFPSAMWRLQRAMSRRRRAARELAVAGGELPPRPILDTPETSVNGSLTAARAVATASLPLGPMLEVKRAAGVTLNDVLLDLVGTGLTDVLAEEGEVPDASLTAVVPVSADPPPTPGEPPRRTGNRLSNLFVSLHTDIDDPGERLAAVHRSVEGAKDLYAAMGADTVLGLQAYTPPGPYRWAMAQYSRHSVADMHSPPVNVIVSNVHGPRRPLWIDGARLVEFFSAGPIYAGASLNVTAWSYLDDMDLLVTSCARRFPEPARLVRAMARALDELADAVGGSRPEGAGGPAGE